MNNWPIVKTTIKQSVCSCHVTYAFRSESTLYSCLNVKEADVLAWSRREIWRFSDCNWTRTQNHLVLKRILNHRKKVSIENHRNHRKRTIETTERKSESLHSTRISKQISRIAALGCYLRKCCKQIYVCLIWI